jgi:hypothetical protein
MVLIEWLRAVKEGPTKWIFQNIANIVAYKATLTWTLITSRPSPTKVLRIDSKSNYTAPPHARALVSLSSLLSLSLSLCSLPRSRAPRHLLSESPKMGIFIFIFSGFLIIF